MNNKNLVCNNITCRYQKTNHTCGKTGEVIIGIEGCKSYKNNLYHYISLVIKEMNNNFIIDYIIDDNIRFGIYAICQIFDLKLCTGRGIIGFGADNFNMLTVDEILSRPLNERNFNFLNDIVINNKVQDFINAQKNYVPTEAESIIEERYGWLSPQGDFLEYDWGEHENGAYEIINSRDLKDFSSGNAGDYLITKGWILIHNPSQNFIEITRDNTKRITNVQRDFLFDYFTNLGLTNRAKEYFE